MRKNFIILLYLIILFSYSGVYSFTTKEYKEVSKIETSLIFLLQKSDSLLESKLNNINKLYLKNNTVEALKLSLALEDELVSNNNELRYKTFFLTAKIYNRLGNTQESLKYYKKSENILATSFLLDKERFSEIFASSDYLKTLNRIGASFQKLSENNVILQYKDSAIYYFKKIESFETLNSESLAIKARSYSNLSGIYEVDSLYVKAEEYAIKAIEIHEQINNKLGVASSLNNLANIYLVQEKFEEAKKLYFEAIELIKNYNSPKAIDRKANLYFNLAWAMRNLKEYEAYDNLEKSYEFTELIRNDNVRKVAQQIRAEYDVGKARQEEITKRQIREQRFWIYFIVSVIIIISLIFYVTMYRQRKKTLALKLANIDYEQKQKIDAVKSESQARVLNATIDGKETERKEIAETLHDNVSALLSSANLHLQASRKHFNGNIPLEIYKSEQIINEASEKIRNLSHNLVSSILLKFGLTYAVKDIIGKYSNSYLTITSDIDRLRRYHQKFEIKTFNIIQEFLNNILKHSKAENANVVLKEQNGNLIIRISDDGIGFDKSKIDEKDGLGINQIDARIKIMKGEFFIDTAIGKGTKIKIDLPILEKEEQLSA